MLQMSDTVKEIINVAIFLIVVGLLVGFYVVYPLSKTAQMMGRTDNAEVKLDSLPANNAQAFIDSGLVQVDTFRVEADGLTNLAAVLVPANDDSLSIPSGMTILLHGEGQTRDSLIPLVKSLVNSGQAVITYDQRASGLSTGKYHGSGRYEASDIEEVLAWLEVRGKTIHPLSVVGFGIGADAALLVDQQEERIDKVVAVEPYLTTTRMLDMQKALHNTIWFPFYRTVIWWWYGVRSGYVVEYRKIEQLQPVVSKTLILISQKAAEEPEFAHLKDISSAEQLIIRTEDQGGLSVDDQIVGFVTTQ
jgi:pimeloyl-ACP methyl ester carboxylesterase